MAVKIESLSACIGNRVAHRFGKAWRRGGLRAGAVVLCVLLASCASHRQPATGVGGAPLATGRLPPGIAAQRPTQVDWSQVPGWQDDSLIGSTAALRQNCLKLGAQVAWQRACQAAQRLDELDPSAARDFFETYFTAYTLANANGSLDGLVTGYYEPMLRGSKVRAGPYIYPLYRWPLAYSTGSALPARAQLERSSVLSGNELVYVDDPIEAFFLQVQGSGRVEMDDGTVLRLGFGGTNNQPYRSIGRWLIDHGEVTPSQATMQGIKNWARANPQRVPALLDVNPRFVFFKEMPGGAEISADGADGPTGALGVPLTPQRSIAVDVTSIPLGTPVFLSTTWPGSHSPLNRLVFAQDVGSAIRGGVRADFFWGLGDDAGDLAGKMKQVGRMWILLPKS